MWLNHLTAYSLEFAYPETWAERLRDHAITAPVAGQRKVIGFRPATTDGEYVDRIEGHYAIQAAVAKRHLPKDAVDREVRERGRAVADEKASKAAWAEVEQQMLSTAPIIEKIVPAVYDADTKLLFVFSSASEAENVVLAALRDALGSLVATPIVPKDEVRPKLTEWLRAGKAPAPFLLGRMAELDTEEEDGKTVFKGQDLSGPLIQQHLDQGDFVSMLALNWGGKLEFRLNYRGEIKNVAPPECKMKAQHAFNIWPDIMDRLPYFFRDVINVLGGSRDLGESIDVQERAAGTPSAEPRPQAEGSGDGGTDSATEPGGRSLRVAFVAFGEEGDFVAVRDGLQNLMQRRNLSEIVLPDIGNPVMRMAYAWFKEQQLPIRLVQKHEGTEEERMHKVFSHTPAGIVMYGRSPELREYDSTAFRRRIPVMRLDPARA